MGAPLSATERRILEALVEAERNHPRSATITDVVRRRLGQLPGLEFRRGVARLHERRLLKAKVATKPDGEVGRVVIEQVTPLGRYLARR